MTELSFAKSFLSTLDNRATKLQPDHVADLKTLEIKGAYTLPRYPSSPPMHPPTTTSSSSSSPPKPTSSTSPPTTQSTTTITLRSLKPPPSLNLSLPNTPLSTSIFDLKTRVKEELQRDTIDGIKILHQRKPCSDSKTVGEVVGEGVEKRGVEFGVLVVGGVVAKDAQEERRMDVKMGDDVVVVDDEGGKSAVGAAQGVSGEEVLDTDEFWDDLKGWLMQRVRDEEKVGEVWSLFKRGWDER
ncbi:MAG: hypothetical protein Q9186_006624 [Xanthomendoza sp. 1 TL-2023]